MNLHAMRNNDDTFTIDIATPDDDSAIRRLLAENPIPGGIRVTYCREPNYFYGCSIMGEFYQVMVCRSSSGKIAAVGLRSIRPMYINGAVENVGYISQLRIDPRYWGHGITRMGFRFARSLDQEKGATVYISSIIERNRIARAIFENRKHDVDFPFFHDFGRINTFVFILYKKKYSIHNSDYTIEQGSSKTKKEIISFLQSEGSGYQFYPFYTYSDFSSNSTRDFRIEDMCVVRYNGQIVGTMGLWDQSGFKQSVVDGYSGLMKFVKPLYNAAARIIRAKPLVPPGSVIHHAYASFLCIKNNDLNVSNLLLNRIYNEAELRGFSYLMLGLHEKSPLIAQARKYPHMIYRSRLYLMSWVDRELYIKSLDNRIPYVEVALL